MAPPYSRRTVAALGASIALGLALTGCGNGTDNAAHLPPTTAHGPTTHPAATTTPPSTARPLPPTGGTAGSSTTSTSAPAPTLGHLVGVFIRGKGFGRVEPAEIDNGGDPTGIVTQITWQSWGGAQATGTGTSDYVAPNQNVAQGTEQQATVVAFDLGTCDGTPMYQAVEWYFPQNGQSFDPNRYENVCTGSYVPGP
jgi:hypothetical protein